MIAFKDKINQFLKGQTKVSLWDGNQVTSQSIKQMIFYVIMVLYCNILWVRFTRYFPVPIQRYKHLTTFFCFIEVPEIEIVDERDKPVKEKFYKGGSTIELKCIVRQIVGQAPEYIIWHHGNRMLNYDIERGGIRYL